MPAYLMKRTTPFILLACLCLACSKATAPEAEKPAITEAVKTYVKDVKKIEVDKVDIVVKDLKIAGDKAECQATFALKDQKEMAFTYGYTLEKKAGTWAVLSSASGGKGHGAMPGGIPGSMPGGTEGGMPPGHPALGDSNAPSGAPAMAGHAPQGMAPPQTPPPANAPSK